MKISKFDWFFALSLILISVVSRWVPHPLNFTPILAVGLFSGQLFGKSFEKFGLSFAVPLLGLLISDALLGFHSTMVYTYGSVAILTLMGTSRSFKTGSWVQQVLLPAMAGSAVFFIITNFGVWHMEGIYEQSLSDLWACYLAGIPFFKNTVLSTFVFQFAFFLVAKFAQKSTVWVKN